MAEVVKTCDLSGEVAARLFEMLNYDSVKVQRQITAFSHCVIVTDVEPNKLRYPEGWYYGKGSFRNKHESSTGIYDEIPMVTTSGEYWGDIAKYCTRQAS